MSVLDLLRADGFITVNKFIAKLLGLHEAIVLSELIRWHSYYEDRDELDEDGMFFVTVDKMEDNTTLTKHLQSKAIATLQQHGLLVSKQKGLPAKRYFKINIDAVRELVDGKKLKIFTPDNRAENCSTKPEKPHGYQKLKKLTTSEQNSRELDRQNLASNKSLDISHDKNDDDDRAASKIFESVKDQITKEKFEEIVERVKRNKPENFANYLHRSVIAEIAKMQAAATMETPVQRQTKRTSNGSRRTQRSTIPVAVAATAPVSTAELEEILAMARKLAPAESAAEITADFDSVDQPF